MTKTELLDIMTVIVMSYPERFKEDSVPGMVTAWYAFFKEDDANAVKLAVTKHIACNKWPPSIAEIRETMVTLQHPELMPPDMAWNLVSDRMHGDSNFNYYHDEALCEIFPPLVAKVVSAIGCSRLKEMSRGQYAGYRNGQDRQSFMDYYIPAYNRARDLEMLPKSVRDTINEITSRSVIPKLIADAHQSKQKYEGYWDRVCELPVLAENTQMNGETENEDF